MSSNESGNKKHWVDPVLLIQDISNTKGGYWGGSREDGWYGS